MDITELMIGDWARLRYFDSITGKEVVKDFQVTSITTESPWHHRAVWSSEGNMGHEHIEGVPLTAEILEKNGWVFQEDYDENDVFFYYRNPECVIRGQWYRRLSVWFGWQEGNPRYSIPSPKYVHQLQQALRLCGLIELANNFKV